MSKNWKELSTAVKDGIISNAVKNGVDEKTISFAMDLGQYLAEDERRFDERRRKEVTIKEKLTTSQVRKFFGEVKRQQMIGYELSTFVLLKPKLAYAVGRSKSKENKIKDFYDVLSVAIDVVISEENNNNNQAFKNFIAIFEAIVAYHKLAENS